MLRWNDVQALDWSALILIIQNKNAKRLFKHFFFQWDIMNKKKHTVRQTTLLSIAQPQLKPTPPFGAYSSWSLDAWAAPAAAHALVIQFNYGKRKWKINRPLHFLVFFKRDITDNEYIDRIRCTCMSRCYKPETFESNPQHEKQCQLPWSCESQEEMRRQPLCTMT